MAQLTKHPSVDVVVPAYNASRFIRETLDSVLNQTYRPNKIIVVNDGSTDDTADIVASYQNPLIQLITLENGGVSRARNAGITASTAEYIAFLDADDTWLPEKLEAQMLQFQANPKAGVVYSGSQLVDETGAKIEGAVGVPYIRGDVFEDIVFYERPIYGTASSIVVARAILMQTALFDETIRYSEDVDLLAQLALLTEFDYVSEPYVHTRINPHSATRNRDWEKSKKILLQNLYYKGKYAARFQYPQKTKRMAAVQILRLFFEYPEKIPEFRNFYSEFRTIAPALSAQMKTNNLASFAVMLFGNAAPEILGRVAQRPQLKARTKLLFSEGTIFFRNSKNYNSDVAFIKNKR